MNKEIEQFYDKFHVEGDYSITSICFINGEKVHKGDVICKLRPCASTMMKICDTQHPMHEIEIACKEGYVKFLSNYKEYDEVNYKFGVTKLYEIYENIEDFIKSNGTYKYLDGSNISEKNINIIKEIIESVGYLPDVYSVNNWAMKENPSIVHKGDYLCQLQFSSNQNSLYKTYKSELIGLYASSDGIIYVSDMYDIKPFGLPLYEIYNTWEEFFEHHPNFITTQKICYNDEEVKKGDVILHIKTKNDEIKLYAEKNGFIKYDFTKYISNESLSNDDKCLLIRENKFDDDLFRNLKLQTYGDYIKIVDDILEADLQSLSDAAIYGEVQTDLFSNQPFIDLANSFYNYANDRNFINLTCNHTRLFSWGITPYSFNSRDGMIIVLEYKGGMAYFKFFCWKRRGVKAGNKTSFMFSNKQCLEYTFVGKPLKEPNPYLNIKEHKWIHSKPEDMYSTTLELFSEDANLFLNEKIIKVKVEYEDNSVSDIVENDNEYIQQIQQDYMRNFLRCMAEISTLRSRKVVNLEIAPNKVSTHNSVCSVYLMYDTSNSCYKIGISKDPNYREQTLQSEKPSIIKITSKQYPHRMIAQAIEKALHEAFSKKRIRGEWFNLTDEDVRMIIETLS